jgi:uncharacterized C2H2 Zn-finger protein
MLIRFCDIVATVRHVELPTKCPGCGKPIKAVTELYLGDGCIDGTLTVEDADDVANFEPDHGASWRDGETLVVTGYRCARCHHVLTQVAFQEEEGD